MTLSDPQLLDTVAHLQSTDDNLQGIHVLCVRVTGLSTAL